MALRFRPSWEHRRGFTTSTSWKNENLCAISTDLFTCRSVVLPGRAAFAAGPADSYLARAKIDERAERSEGQFDLSSYEATYVFQVFNRR